MKKLFHLSESNLHGKYLYPRVPHNYMTKHGYEENTIPRVCFSESIDGALTALGYNIKDKVFLIHEPMDYNVKTLSNSGVMSSKYVPDGHITLEAWVLEPVQLRVVGSIKIIDAIDSPLPYTYGDGKTAELYRWKYVKQSSSFMNLIKN